MIQWKVKPKTSKNPSSIGSHKIPQSSERTRVMAREGVLRGSIADFRWFQCHSVEFCRISVTTESLDSTVQLWICPNLAVHINTHQFTMFGEHLKALHRQQHSTTNKCIQCRPMDSVVPAFKVSHRWVHCCFLQLTGADVSGQAVVHRVHPLVTRSQHDVRCTWFETSKFQKKTVVWNEISFWRTAGHQIWPGHQNCWEICAPLRFCRWRIVQNWCWPRKSPLWCSTSGWLRPKYL